tara:strand:- start:590 stop:751 length:162 start_codon:yes stop_codon:yes gene_type:complete
MKSMNKTDLGNSENSKVKANKDRDRRDPKKEDLTILIKSLMLVYLHIPRYNPK